MKSIVLAFSLLQIFSTNSFADCENFLRGFHVDSSYSDHRPNESVYYMISSDDLGLRATIVARDDQCTSTECKAMVDTLHDAIFQQLIKLGVDKKVCGDLYQYFMMVNAGGSTDVIPMQLITSVVLDKTYPF